jgi:limonene-1,2-epoxide hydrolase
MSDTPESVVRRFLAAFQNWPNVDELASFFAEKAVFIDGPRGVHQGLAAIKSELEAQAETMGFRNFNADINSLVADGGTVMLERVDSFTVGRKPFSMEIMAAFEIEDGRIKRWRECYDLKSIADQVEAAGFHVPS